MLPEWAKNGVKSELEPMAADLRLQIRGREAVLKALELLGCPVACNKRMQHEAELEMLRELLHECLMMLEQYTH